MQNLPPDPPSAPRHNPIYREDAAKTHILIAYVLMTVGLFTGVFWVIGAVWAMLKKGDAQGTVFVDHYSNIIATFWWCLILSVVGWFLTFVLVGWVILFFVWLYGIYKVVKGLLKVVSNKPYAS